MVDHSKSRRCLLSIGLLVLISAAPARPQAPQAPQAGATVPAPIFVYHTSFWLNLHHFLYVLGRVEAKMPDISRQAVAGAPDDEARGLAALSEEERRVWRETVAAYAKAPSRLNMVFDAPLIQAGQALARAAGASTLAGAGVEPDLTALLERAAPIYRKAWWPAHEAANQARMKELDALVQRHGRDVLAFVTRVYGEEWPPDGYPIQLSAWVNWSGAFSTRGRHLVVSSLDDGTGGALGLETLFHEAMHQWDDAMENRLAAAATKARTQVPPNLSHAMIFFTAGEAIRRVIPGHEPYAQARGVWNRGMGAFKGALEAAWKPYLDGAGTLDQALANLLAHLSAPPPR